MKKIKLKTLYLISIITLGLIGLGIGSTYAMFTTSVEIDDPISLSTTLTSESDIIETFDIEVAAGSNKEIPLTINNTSNSKLNYSVWYKIAADDTEMGTKLSNSDSSPSSSTIASGETKKVYIQIKNSSTSSIIVTLGVSSSTGNIVLSNSMTIVPNTELVFTKNLAEYITNLYTNTSKTTVINNDITYNYASSESLMNDRLGSASADINGGNIHYYGADPNNYIYFNCTDYNNQTSDTCEIWRIIGVFNGKVKIIRGESIGSFSYDNSITYGSNVWSSSRLMKLLNPNYTGTGGSLYWNSKSGTCYSGQSTNGTKTCNFTTIGLKNDTTRNMVANANWNNGERTTAFQSAAEAYANEITATTNSYVGLAISSDYGYATDFNNCTVKLYLQNSTVCKTNNWMTSVFPAKESWLLTPGQGSNYSWVVDDTYEISGVFYAYYEHNVLPVVHLKPSIKINGNGEGTSTNPYQITFEDSSEDSKLPSGYQEVEYIGSTGTQYIKTNVNCGYNDTIKMESTGNFNFSSNNGFWQGANGYLQHKFTSSSVSDGNSTLTFSDNDTITVLYDGTNHTETITVGSTGKSITRSWSGSSSYGGNVVFLKMSDKTNIYSSTGVTSYLKRGKVYVSGVLTLDLIPAVRKSDNVAGMYDIINGNFYTNSGSGTFTVGSNV